MPKAQFPKITLAKKAFLEYLRAHPRKKFLNVSTNYCPVALFVESQIDTKHFGVIVADDATPDAVVLSYYGERKRRKGGELVVEATKKFAMPDWMLDFINVFDNEKGSGDDHDTLTGAEILARELI